MKLRDKISLLVDLLLMLALTLIAGIGLLIKYTLPPGRERILKYGNNRELAFLGLDRHQWGEIHLVAGYVMLALLFLHILFHWKVILCLVRKVIAPVWLRRFLWLILGVLCVMLLLFAFFIAPEQRETGDFLHRNIRSDTERSRGGRNQLSGADREAETTDMEKAAGERQINTQRQYHAAMERERGSQKPESNGDGVRHLHGTEDRGSLNGRMTLNEASIAFGISTEEAKRRLKLPFHVPDNETLGHLRRAYSFTMQEARESLEKAE